MNKGSIFTFSEDFMLQEKIHKERRENQFA